MRKTAALGSFQLGPSSLRQYYTHFLIRFWSSASKPQQDTEKEDESEREEQAE